MTCLYRPKRRMTNGCYEPWRKMIAADLGLDLLVSQYDPDLLRVGIEAPRMSAEEVWRMRSKAAGFVAGKASATRPKTEAQLAVWRQRGTVDAKIVRQEVGDILARYRNLGAVRVRST